MGKIFPFTLTSDNSRRAILALRLLSEVHREFSQPLHVAFVDLKAAFDSVDRLALWKALRGIGMPQYLLQLIEDLHNGSTSSARSVSPPELVFHWATTTSLTWIMQMTLSSLLTKWMTFMVPLEVFETTASQHGLHNLGRRRRFRI